MINYDRTRSTVKPDPIRIDDFSVWVHTDIQAISEDEFIGYEFNMTCYEKNEYIALQNQRNEEQISNIYSNIYSSLPTSVQAEIVEEEAQAARKELEGILK